LAAAVEKPKMQASSSRSGNERVAKLEEESRRLRQELTDLKQQFVEFKKQL